MVDIFHYPFPLYRLFFCPANRVWGQRFYQKITDIYSQCSADYDVESPITKEFFATVQNKLHYAVTHHTAAEIVYGRADSTKPNMGLATW